MLKIELRESYLTDLEDLLNDSPDLRERIELAVKLFRKNPDDTRLVNHALKRRMVGKWAFSVTGDIRVVYLPLGKNEVRFIAIGGHSKVYQRRR